MNLRFLLDENLSLRLKKAVQRHYPEIDILRVGDTDAPPLGTLDHDVLSYLETHQRVLLTDNRHSMPAHIADHLAAGGHHWGIFMVHKNRSIGRLVAEIHLYWSASEAEEWIDRVEWLDV